MNEIAVVMEKTSLLSDKDELVAEAEMESDQKDTEVIKDSDKDEIVAEAEIESDQKDSEVIKDSEEINGSDADDSNDENASTTYPDVD